MEPYWDSIEQIIMESDIVLEILDARMPELSRNKKVEEMIQKFKRPSIFVVNKCDLVPKHELEISIQKLMSEGVVVAVSNKSTKTIKILISKIMQLFAKHGKRPTFSEKHILKKPHREARGDIVVGVVGYPNVGKSSVINGLAFKKKMTVSSKAGTTHGIHWIKAGKFIRLIDTPGVVPMEYTEEAKLGLISARSPEKIRDPEYVAGKIVEMFIDNNKIERLERFYDLKLEGETNPYEIIIKIAMIKGHLKRGGVADDTRTSIMVVRDWQNGKLKL